jgi:hypothetical protein
MRQRFRAYVFVLLTLLIAFPAAEAQSRRRAAQPVRAGAETSAEQSDEVTFVGKVLNDAGNPISAAEVRLYEVTYGGSRYSYEAKLVAQQQSSVDGSFTFTTTKDPDVYRNASIIVHKEGLAVG